MHHWWAAWLAGGAAAEIIALSYGKRTLSQALASIVDSRWRRIAWGGFCAWFAFHIVTTE